MFVIMSNIYFTKEVRVITLLSESEWKERHQLVILSCTASPFIAGERTTNELSSDYSDDEDYHPSLDSNDGIYSFENKFSTSDPISFYHQYISK